MKKNWMIGLMLLCTQLVEAAPEKQKGEPISELFKLIANADKNILSFSCKEDSVVIKATSEGHLSMAVTLGLLKVNMVGTPLRSKGYYSNGYGEYDIFMIPGIEGPLTFAVLQKSNANKDLVYYLSTRHASMEHCRLL